MESSTRFPLVPVIGVGVGVVCTAAYIFGFIFIHGSIPGANKKQDEFIDKTCAPSGLLKTVLTWGYTKATWRRFLTHYKGVLFPQPQAKLGQRAPDAVLITLDGQECLLLCTNSPTLSLDLSILTHSLTYPQTHPFNTLYSGTIFAPRLHFSSEPASR